MLGGGGTYDGSAARTCALGGTSGRPRRSLPAHARPTGHRHACAATGPVAAGTPLPGHRREWLPATARPRPHARGDGGCRLGVVLRAACTAGRVLPRWSTGWALVAA